MGLKTGGETSIQDRAAILDRFQGQKGESIGLFKVFDRTDSEIILGEDDKHLDFRVSLLIDPIQENNKKENKKNLTISTTVYFNNWLGKLYFLPVKPFHKFIVPIMLKGIIKSVEDNAK